MSDVVGQHTRMRGCRGFNHTNSFAVAEKSCKCSAYTLGTYIAYINFLTVTTWHWQLIFAVVWLMSVDVFTRSQKNTPRHDVLKMS